MWSWCEVRWIKGKGKVESGRLRVEKQKSALRGGFWCPKRDALGRQAGSTALPGRKWNGAVVNFETRHNVFVCGGRGKGEGGS